MKVQEFLQPPLLNLVKIRSLPSLVWGIILVGLFVVLYQDTFYELMHQWDTNIYYAHGYLMLPLAAWLLWRKRVTLRQLPTGSSWSGLFFLVSGLVLFAVSFRAEIIFLQGLSFILVLAGGIHTLWGRRALREATFPLFVLIFMLPLPYLLLDPIGFPMKQSAAGHATSLLQLLGVPVWQDGVYLHLPNYTLVVEDVCNGLRSLISIVTVSTVLTHIVLPNYRDRVLLIAASIPISLGANIVRITMTALMGYYVSDQLAQGFLHELSGLFVFLLSLGGLLVVVRVILWRRELVMLRSLSA